MDPEARTRFLRRALHVALICFAAQLAASGVAVADEGDASLKSCVTAVAVSGCASEPLLGGAYGIALSPDGKHAYVTTHNTHAIVTFAINQANGSLSRLPGSDGCVRNVPSSGDCQDGRALALITDIVVSADGKHAYAGGYSSGAIAIFDRNATTGKLTQKTGTAGCIHLTAAEGCADGRALSLPVGLKLSGDGKNLYGLHESGAVTVFDRNTATGALVQKDDEAGCVSNTGADGCALGRAMGGFSSQLDISTDGRHLYAPTPNEGGIVLFNRDTATGEIVQKPGKQGCITFDGSPTTPGDPLTNVCQDGSTDLAGTKAVLFSPSTNHLYSLTSSGIVTNNRNSTDGTLTQTSCITESGSGGACTNGLSLSGLWAASFSPDGKDLAVTDFNAAGGTGLRFLRRNTTTGALSQRPTTARCATQNGFGNGVAGACRTQLSLGGYGLIRYAPNGKFFYAAQNSRSAAVTLDRDFLPVCQSASISVPHNTAVAVPLRCSDQNGDPIDLQITRNPGAGLLAAIDQTNDLVRYNPFSGFSGTDTFVFRGIARGAPSNSATTTLTVASAPITGGGGGGLDADGDGFIQECDDTNPNIRPNAPEIRGNAVDENCDGVKSPFLTIKGVTVSREYAAFTGFTRLLKIQVKGVPRGATVRVTCKFKKKKCPGKARKAFTKRGARGTVSLNKRYKGVRLKVGTKITVTVTRPNMIGAVKILTIRKRKPPSLTDRCLTPGARRATRC